MREHIEALIRALRATVRASRRTVPRQRRPRVARSTYTPVRREPLPDARFAH